MYHLMVGITNVTYPVKWEVGEAETSVIVIAFYKAPIPNVIGGIPPQTFNTYVHVAMQKKSINVTVLNYYQEIGKHFTLLRV